MRYIGTRVPRREDRELLTGAARTVADISRPDTVELAFARSPLAHARIRSISAEPARAVEGVIGAWAAADLPGLTAMVVPAGEDSPPRRPLATDAVRYPGEPFAVVAATSRALAEDGAERITADFEPLPPVVDPESADTAPQLFADRDNVAVDQHVGEPAEETFAGAPIVVEGRFRQQLVLPGSIEPRAIMAEPSAEGITVWASHQAQHRLRDGIAEALGMSRDAVRVIVPATGGAFGAKSQLYPEYLAVAFLARMLGRPVRWCEDRAEAMLAATRGRGQTQRTRLAADSEGNFLAYELRVDADVGGYPHTGAFVPTMTGAMSTGAYRTPHVHAHIRSLLTTTAPTSAYRGAGRPEAAYALERTVDILAHRMGRDPAELRRLNFIRPEQFPYETPTGRTYDSGNYAAALDKALRAVDYAAIRAEQELRRKSGDRPLGIGMATYVERSGGQENSQEFGSVEACADGTFVARCGSTPTGQGHLTAFAQVVAEALDVPMERVRVIEGDTKEIPDGHGTFGSRSMQVGGAALWQAAKQLIDEAERRFAEQYGVPPESVSYVDGRVGTPDRQVALGELAPLRVDTRFVSPQAFPFGAYVAVVEVDPELGVVDVRRLVAVDDYGVVVNPMIVDGQGYGSVAQGIGQVLYEDAVLREDGIPYARTLLDYLMPTAADVPAVQLLETETPNPNVPFGAKGAGEAGCIGTPPAVVNAVCDALQVEHIDMPLTPEAVWRAARRSP